MLSGRRWAGRFTGYLEDSLSQRCLLKTTWCARKNPVDIRRVAQRAVAGHFKSVKMKGFPGDPIVKSVEAIAAVSSDLKVTVDTEGNFKDAAQFLPVGLGLDAIGNMQVIEDPVAHSNMAGFVELRNQLKTRLALHTGGSTSANRGDPSRCLSGIQYESLSQYVQLCGELLFGRGCGEACLARFGT